MNTLLEPGRRKYAGGTLLEASRSHQWPDLAAEHRQHPPVLLSGLEQRHVEIGIVTRQDDTRITRRANGERHIGRTGLGTIWLCPVGIQADEVQSDGPVEFLHLYLPPSRFDRLADICGGVAVPATAIGYLGGIRDETIEQAGLQILNEMRRPTAGGHILVDALALFLTVHLARTYAATQGRLPKLPETKTGLDDARLYRVLDYMRAHIETEIDIEELASVACLSPFHFARMFRARTGVPPHRYLSSMRLERAKAALARGDSSIAEIAAAACFSNQANFTRAFKLATGVTPREFRRQAG